MIPVPDERSGEVPKAYVVKSNSVGLEESAAMVKRGIQKHVEKSKARHKWLTGGVEFVSMRHGPGQTRGHADSMVDRHDSQVSQRQDITTAPEGQGEASEDGARGETVERSDPIEGGYVYSQSQPGTLLDLYCGGTVRISQTSQTSQTSLVPRLRMYIEGPRTHFRFAVGFGLALVGDFDWD